MLNQILLVLSSEEEIPSSQEDSTMVRINPKAFFEGLEEAVHLSMLLAKKEYSQILSVLQTTKTRVGRLQDDDFESFKPYYAHLAKMFFLHHTYVSTRPGLQRKGYQNLVQFFQATTGMTQTKVQREIQELTRSEAEASKEYFQQSPIDKIIDPLY